MMPSLVLTKNLHSVQKYCIINIHIGDAMEWGRAFQKPTANVT